VISEDFENNENKSIVLIASVAWAKFDLFREANLHRNRKWNHRLADPELITDRSILCFLTTNSHGGAARHDGNPLNQSNNVVDWFELQEGDLAALHSRQIHSGAEFHESSPHQLRTREFKYTKYTGLYFIPRGPSS
jgi:hypothetical protein